MNQLFILFSDNVERVLVDTQLKVLQDFGQETVVDNAGKVIASGVAKLLTGTKEDFNKLLQVTGELWVNTNPILNSWQQLTLDKTS
jgi:hypothetical protein